MLEIPDKLKPLLQRPVAILGMGVGGQGVAKLLGKLGVAYEAFDLSAEGASSLFTEEVAEVFSLVIYSQSFHEAHPWRVAAKKAGCMCLGEADFGAAFWPGRIIAVTGTNGKTTVTALLTEALKRAGFQADALGNIGSTMTHLLAHETRRAHSIAVCEVSSYQCDSLHYLKPDTLIWSNLSEDHLSRHGDMHGYFDAKYALLEACTGPSFIGESVMVSAEALGYDLPQRVYSVKADSVEAPEASPFSVGGQAENYALVARCLAFCNVPLDILRACASAFQLPKHRLSQVNAINGVSFWNDSKATNLAAVKMAVSSVPKPIYWIGGGQNKGNDLEAFSFLKDHIQEAFLIGEVAEGLVLILQNQNIPARVYLDLETATQAAYSKAAGRGSVLLSPGFASWDQFESYSHRGNCFEEYVLGLKNASEYIA